MIELKKGTVIIYNDTGLSYVLTGAADSNRGFECTDSEGGRHWYSVDFIGKRFTVRAEVKVGNVLKSKISGKHFIVTAVNSDQLELLGYDGKVGIEVTGDLSYYDIYDSILDVPPTTPSTLDTQHGGDHYKKLGDYQPWQVLQAWLTPEEFKGYMKGSSIAYLAREAAKGGDLDIEKATHTLQAFLEMKDERL